MAASQAASPTQDAELFSIDFLALTGLDSGIEAASPSSASAGGSGGLFNGNTNGEAGHHFHHIGQSQTLDHPLAQPWEQSSLIAGPSSLHRSRDANGPDMNSGADFTLDAPSASTSSTVRSNSTRGRARSTGNKRQSTAAQRKASQAAPPDPTMAPTMGSMEMDVDQLLSQAQSSNPFAAFGEDVNVMDILNGAGGLNGQDYDAVQAALLQQQLQAIHMQSPLGFDISNPQFPLAQMFLASPSTQYPHITPGQETGEQGNNVMAGNGAGGKWSNASLSGGVLTPGPSGEMHPQARQDLMSPMQLEILARTQLDTHNDPNMLPLLSPALSQSTSASSYASPANQAAFSSHGGQNSQPYQNQSHSQSATKSPIEQLQEQQRQFQEQLALLQQQQLEMAATAAAVVAASTSTNVSPYMSSSGPSSGHSRPAVTTPGVNASPQYFSPLTSPALEATNRLHRSHGHTSSHHYSPGFANHQPRPPHPLSALSSPALNPVGSSGGAQQTLSPALGPVNSADMSDPDYIRALVGMLDGNPQPQNEHSQPIYNSPSAASASTAGNSTILASPALHPSLSSGTGPHRNALPSKTRPSPMLKPSNHRSHHRTPSGSVAFSHPTNSPSPVVPKFQQHPVPGMGYLPPSAIDHRQLQSNASQSTASTPSPVDLSQIMPPPPVPGNTSKSNKAVTPMTPASLMNLASSMDGNAAAVVPPPPQSTGRRQSAGPTATNPTARGATKKAIAPATTPTPATNGTKKGGKLVPATNGKRALAIRPQSGVGVRAATKAASAAAAAAAAAALAGEPETRKTSHKAAEQKRRDSLKAGFDELRLLLPAINTEALDPESGEPIPGSSAPRLLPKSSLVPDDNPNRGVSKVALLKFSNEYIVKLHERVDKRDGYIDRLREEVRRLREGVDGEEVRGDQGEDLLEIDIGEGEDDEFGPPEGEEEEVPQDDDEDLDEVDEEDDEMELDLDEGVSGKAAGGGRRRAKSTTNVAGKTKSPALKATATQALTKRPGLTKSGSSSNTVTMKGRRGD